MHKDAVYLYGIFKGKEWSLSMRAITMAHEWHKGHKRDDNSEYFEHPLTACRSLLNLNNPKIVNDVVAAAALLHDVLEDKRTTAEELKKEFGEEVAHLVDLLTKKEGEKEDEYYKRVAADPRAMLIKAADREWNIFTMVRLVAKTGDIERMARYILNTKIYVLPMIKSGRRKHLDFSDAYVSYRDHIVHIIELAEFYLREVEKRKKLEETLAGAQPIADESSQMELFGEKA